MQPTRTAAFALALGALAVVASADQRPTRDDLRRQIEQCRAKAALEIEQARNRVEHKNFLAARSATQDARSQVGRLRKALPWERLLSHLNSAEKNVRVRLFKNALRDIDKAFRELDYQAQFIKVGGIWQHLEAARDACKDKNEDVAGGELRAAKDLATVEEVLLPIKRAEGYLADASEELLKLPIFFKGKRDDIVQDYDKAEAELRQADALIADLIAGKFSQEPPEPPTVPMVPPVAP